MADIYLPNNSICNTIAHNIAYNANYDIVWSFDYSLSGHLGSQGSFTTFIFDGDTNLSGGAPGPGGAYFKAGNYLSGGSSIYTDSLLSAVIGINFDTTGLFALSGSNANGIINPIPNSLSIRYGQTNFNFLTSLSLTSLYSDFNFLLSAQKYNSLRFRLTNVGQLLKIDYKVLDSFVEILKIPVKLPISNNTKYKIGIGYTSPVSGSSAYPAKFSIKNFHVEGNLGEPSSTIISSPNNSFNMYPVCALPVILPPSDLTTVQKIPRIFDIPCPVQEEAAQPVNVCLASFMPQSGSEDIFDVSNLHFKSSFTQTSYIPTLSTESQEPIYINCSTSVSGDIIFDLNTRNTVSFPVRYIVDLGSKIGTSFLNYTVYNQPVQFEVKQSFTTGQTSVSSLSYVCLNSYQLYSLISELSLRGLDPAPRITSLSSASIPIQNTSTTNSNVEINVYGPVNGARYVFTVTCPDNSASITGTPLTGITLSGRNYTSPLSGDYTYYPYNFLTLPWKNNTTYNFSFSAQSLPERFQVVDYNSDRVLLDTLWVGESGEDYLGWLNRYLARVEQPLATSIKQGISAGVFRTISTGPIAVRVYSPLFNSRWAFRIT